MKNRINIPDRRQTQTNTAGVLIIAAGALIIVQTVINKICLIQEMHGKERH